MTISRSIIEAMERKRIKSDSQIVLEIIEDKMKTAQPVYKQWLIEKISTTTDYLRLRNKAEEEGSRMSSSMDGEDRIRLGARRMFSDAMGDLEGRYIVRRDGLIEIRPHEG